MAVFPLTIAHLIPRPRLFYQLLAFALTFLVYVMVHATRKSISSAASLLKDPEFAYPTTFFGVMDVVFMLAYAIGMVFTGILGDTHNPIYVMLLAAILTALVQCIFGVIVVFLTSSGFHYLYYFMNTCNGVFQSAIWPVLVKIMGNYFGDMHSGIIFGIWATNAAVGNIVGANLASLMIVIFGESGRTVISATFITPAVILALVGFFTLVTLPESLEKALCRITPEQPTTEFIINDDGAKASGQHEADGNSQQSDRQRVKFWRAWLIPGVLVFALTYACVKGVNYAMFFWLPLYLHEHAHLSPEQANLFDTVYNVGVVVGSLACGWLSDMMAVIPDSGRAPSLFLFQALALIPVSLLHVDEPSIAYLYAMLSLAGFFIGGAANVVSSAVCTDLGRQDALKGNRDAVSQIAGIIDGVGACGAAIQQGLVSWIATYSWDGVFILLPVALGISCVLIARLAYRETKAFITGRYRRKVSSDNVVLESNVCTPA